VPGLDHLDLQRVLLLRRLSAWSPHELVHRPGLAQWCALDVIDHLAKVDAHLAEQVVSAERSAVNLKEHAMHGLVLLFMLLPARVRSPVALPETPDSLEEAVERWIRAATQLRAAFEALPARAKKDGIARHPVSGTLSARMCIRFLRAHLHHHLYQIERIHRSAQTGNGTSR
jgi:hypothetical protein